MTAVPALDALVEPLTDALVRLADDRDAAETVRLAAGAAAVEFTGESTWLVISLPGDDDLPPGLALWDAQVILLLAMGFLPDDEGVSLRFVLEVELEEGETWEEQTLREYALQVLGILYYVYDLRDVGRYSLVVA